MIFMIGHSNHTWDAFLSLLQTHHITRLIDVRTNPTSRWNQFRKASLSRKLEEAAIEYAHIPALGGKNPLSADEMRPHISTLRLASLLPDRRICLMCSEGDFHECHRHYLLTPLFAEIGSEVQQIAPDGGLIPDPGPTPETLQRMKAYLPA